MASSFALLACGCALVVDRTSLIEYDDYLVT